jgi:hypothetical protein
MLLVLDFSTQEASIPSAIGRHTGNSCCRTSANNDIPSSHRHSLQILCSRLIVTDARGHTWPLRGGAASVEPSVEKSKETEGDTKLILGMSSSDLERMEDELLDSEDASKDNYLQFVESDSEFDEEYYDAFENMLESKTDVPTRSTKKRSAPGYNPRERTQTITEYLDEQNELELRGLGSDTSSIARDGPVQGASEENNPEGEENNPEALINATKYVPIPGLGSLYAHGMSQQPENGEADDDVLQEGAVMDTQVQALCKNIMSEARKSRLRKGMRILPGEEAPFQPRHFTENIVRAQRIGMTTDGDDDDDDSESGAGSKSEVRTCIMEKPRMNQA